MRVFATSDMHGNLDGLDPTGCDIVVIAGDFAKLSGFGKWHLHDQKKWVEKKFFKWIESYPGIEFIVVPGNHDLCFDSMKTTWITGLDWRLDFPLNAHLLVDKEVEVKGLRVYGTPHIPVISHTWAFETPADKLRELYSKIPSGLDILVTHSPPHIPGSSIDRSVQFGGDRAFGSNELSEEVIAKKPRFLFCGHIHSGTHGGVKFDSCMVYNVSRVDESYEIAYEPTIIDV